MERLALFIMATLVIVPSTSVRAVDPQDLPKELTLSQAITIALANNSILRTLMRDWISYDHRSRASCYCYGRCGVGSQTGRDQRGERDAVAPGS